MADMTERTTNEATALNEATDRVIREMTQVHVSDDAVQRVMARVRAASDTERAAATADRFGGFGALFAPRVSWGMMAATAALAAIVAAGVTLVAVQATSHGDGTALTASVAPPNPAAPVVSPVRRTQTTPRP